MVNLFHVLGLAIVVAGTLFVWVLPSSKTEAAMRFKATAAICVGIGWAVVILSILSAV